jgi:hypothetical protein
VGKAALSDLLRTKDNARFFRPIQTMFLDGLFDFRMGSKSEIGFLFCVIWLFSVCFLEVNSGLGYRHLVAMQFEIDCLKISWISKY